ncbi:MAG: glycosyltransferase family 2 protein [Bacteroidales bacterium]|nr:glycosyltransferase family 2 protein [Bacteroidales bacterium]
MIKVSVVVAVYNVAQYIERCAVSLFEQTLDEVEYIFVDDCSTDDSIAVVKNVLKRYPVRAKYVNFISNNQNSKVAYTRAVGMKAATGEYIIHCDPDDYHERNAFEIMYNAAVESKADIAVGDYFSHREGTEIVKNNLYNTIPSECIKHIHEFYFFPSLWSALLRRELVEKHNLYPYPNINTGEDLNVLLRAFHYAGSCVHIEKPVYHYIFREGSLTQNNDYLSLWNNNISKNLKLLIDFFEETGDEEYRVMLNFLKFSKKMVLLSTKPAQARMWYEVYPECKKDIFKFKNMSIARRVMYFAFANSYPLLWLYYKALGRI